MTIFNSDQIVWDSFRKGNKEAFNQIYYNHIRALYNYGAKFTGNTTLVEDCIQELFTDLWIKRNKLATTNHIKPYLYKSLKRRLLRQLGKEKKNHELTDYPDFSISYSPEDEMIRKHNAEVNSNKLNSMLQTLTAKQKEAIFLKYYELLSHQEIAEILQVEVKSVYKLLARALDRLKNLPFILLLILQKFS